jgi:hypothetical protein
MIFDHCALVCFGDQIHGFWRIALRWVLADKSAICPDSAKAMLIQRPDAD